MDYGKRLKQIRESKQISVYKLAQDVGMSQGHISDLENGRNVPTIDTLKRLLTPFGITLSEFFNENSEVSILNEKEKELVAQFRTLPDDKADLALQLVQALNR